MVNLSEPSLLIKSGSNQFALLILWYLGSGGGWFFLTSLCQLFCFTVSTCFCIERISISEFISLSLSLEEVSSALSFYLSWVFSVAKNLFSFSSIFFMLHSLKSSSSAFEFNRWFWIVSNLFVVLVFCKSVSKFMPSNTFLSFFPWQIPFDRRFHECWY